MLNMYCASLLIDNQCQCSRTLKVKFYLEYLFSKLFEFYATKISFVDQKLNKHHMESFDEKWTNII